MKSNKILVAVMATLIMYGSISCSNNEIIESPVAKNQKELVLQDLQNKIEAYNTQRFGGMERDSRRGKFFRWFWKVVVSDAVGAILGSLAGPGGTVVGAATASGIAAIPAVNDRIDVSVGTSSSTGLAGDQNLNIDSLLQSRGNRPIFSDDPFGRVVPRFNGNQIVRSTIIDSVGFYHNRALFLLNQDNPNWYTLTNDQITSELSKRVCYVTGWNTAAGDSLIPDSTLLKIQTFNEQIQNAVENSYDAHEVCSKLAEIYPECSAELNILSSTISGLENCNETEANSLDYIESILNIVDNSSISVETKSQIRSGIIVSNASSKLWNPEALGLGE